METAPIWRVGGNMALFVPRAWLPCAGRGLVPSPAPTPRGDSHHSPLPGLARGIGRVRVQHRLTRAAGDPHQNPQNKMKCSTSASCHLILETFVACWDGRHSGLTREDAKFGIIPCNAPSRPSRLRVRRRYSITPHAEARGRPRRGTGELSM